MVITVAGDKKEVKDAITVSELIVQENVETPQYVTVSVNDDFIDRAEFDTYALKRRRTALNFCTSWEVGR